MATLDFDCITSGPFQTNAFLLIDRDTNKAALVDPCYSADKLWPPVIEEQGVELESILLTHGHIDHTSGVADMLRLYPGLPVLLHRGDEFMLTGGNQMAAQMFGLPPFETFTPTGYLEDGQKVRVGGVEFDVIFAPGHSPGSVAFLHGKNLIGGDVLFAGSIGRTDLPGGDTDLLFDSIRTRFMTLPDDVILYPGHGPETTIGQERKSNPFVLQMMRGR